jgi:hypothetical protein
MAQEMTPQKLKALLGYLAEQLYPQATSLAKGEPARPIPNLPASPGKVQGTDDPRMGGGALELVDLLSNVAPVKAMAALPAAAVKAARALPATETAFQTLKGKNAAQAFHGAIAEAKAASPNGAAVALYSPEEYAGMKLFTTPDKTAGFAVKPDGDIVSVFKHPKSPHKDVINKIMPAAIKAGGTKLDAFDPWLPQQYGRHGFVEKARLPFNREYAPEGWNYATSGEPDVVFMALDKGQPFKHGAGPKVGDYDEAVQLQTAPRSSPVPLTPQERAVGATDALFPQYAERYPEVGPPELAFDKKKKKEYLAKKLTPEAEAFKKERDRIVEDMETHGYRPYYDPAKRFNVDPKNYPVNVDTLGIVPKKQATIDKDLQTIGAEETRKRLQDAYKRGQELGNANDWYAMGQMEADFIKELGAEKGRAAFRERLATSMGATTGGADPTSNLIMSQYGNYLRTNNLPYPEAAYEMPFPVGGRYVTGNMQMHKRIFDDGGFKSYDEQNPKRHNFGANFMGHSDRATMDEQMTELMTPGIGMPPPGKYGLYEGTLHEEAGKVGVPPMNFQDVAWAGAKNEPGKPFISHVNDAIERTHRLTGMPRDEIMRRGFMLGQIPIYGMGGMAIAPGLLAGAGWGGE